MTAPTEDTAPAEWPDSVVRNNFPFDDYRTISGHWTEWDEPTRRTFADLVASTRPSNAAAAIDDFLAGHDPAQIAETQPDGPGPADPGPQLPIAPDPDPDTIPEDSEPVVPDPGQVAPATDGAEHAAPAETPASLPGPDHEPAADIEPPSDAGQQPADVGDEGQAERVYAALRTAVTAKAWADEHPDDVAAMIAYEESDDGKGRKTVLHALRELRDHRAQAGE